MQTEINQSTICKAIESTWNSSRNLDTRSAWFSTMGMIDGMHNLLIYSAEYEHKNSKEYTELKSDLMFLWNLALEIQKDCKQ